MGEFISKLREYREDENGILHWATFDGLVRGKPEIDGYRPPRYADFDQVGYFGFKEGLAMLNEIRAFWNDYEGDPNAARLENPHLQRGETAISFEVSIDQFRQQKEQKAAQSQTAKPSQSINPGM